jgi:selenium metabolism protein YedF
MNSVNIDCQGLACPQPVLRCKDTIQEHKPERIFVLVDNEAAQVNVSRFLKNQSYEVISVKHDNEITTLEAIVHAKQGDTAHPTLQTSSSLERTEPSLQRDEQLILITSDVIGRGDDSLGSKLMQNFIATLPEMGNSLWRIILINGAVKLAIEGSPALEHFKKLEQEGVSILVCGTCLDHFNLLENKQIGETTNMLDVVTSLQLASKVIKV